jgi:hypothetical protein
VWAQEGDPRVFQRSASQIRGVVQIRGCTPDISDINLRAVPLEVDTTRRDAAILDARAVPVQARLTRTSDGHRFNFLIQGLQPATPYQLSISVPPSPVCGTLFWRNDAAGLAVSGGEPVLIEGVAATTSVEVMQPSTDQWVSADPLDFTDPAAASRRLRWRSHVPGVVSGELQISTSVFPNRGDFGACDEPSGGVVYRQYVPAVQGEWSDIAPINFSHVVLRRLSGGDGAVTATSPGSSTTLRHLLVGAPVYARVVPITASGPACDITGQGVPGWVMFVKLPADTVQEPEPSPGTPVLEPGSGHEYKPPFFFHPSAYQPHTIYPTYGDYGYRVVKPHVLPTYDGCSPATTSFLVAWEVPYSDIPVYADPLGCTLVRDSPTYSGSLLNAGFRFVVHKTYASHGGGSILEQVFGGFFTGFVGVLGTGANFVADVYNGAVDGVKDLAYEFLLTTPGLGQLCESHPGECQQGISIGLTYGMASMGLPPSLPSWDQLKDEGVDYLAEQVGDQLEEETGGVLPSEVTHYVLKKLVQEAIDQMSANRGGTSPTTSWVVSDVGFTPASWSVSIRRNTSGVELLDVAVRRQKSSLYLGADVPLPHRFPPPLFVGFDSLLRVPMVLTPNVNDIAAPRCRSSFYTTPQQQCVPFDWPWAKPVCEYQTNTGPNSPWHTDENCESYTDLVAIYYRNAWAAKVAATNCIPLAALTVAKGPASVQYIVWPHYTFVVGANVPPMLGGSWDGPFINACQ